MLLSLFDNFFEEKKPASEAPKKLDNFRAGGQWPHSPRQDPQRRRVNNRITVNSGGVLIRLAANQPIDEKKKHIDHFLKWAKGKLDKNPQTAGLPAAAQIYRRRNTQCRQILLPHQYLLSRQSEKYSQTL
jgi:hypothetical protein